MTLAWHFLRDDKRLQFPPHTLVEVGVPLRAIGSLVTCHNGMHGSVRAIDALKYAPGPIVCRVRHDGEILRANDKLCSRTRTAIAMFDATNVLHEFACRAAEVALLLAEVTDQRCWNAIEAKRAWLRGDIDNEQLSAARDVAWDAAWDAARGVARGVAWDVAWDAAWDEMNALLEQMLTEAMK